MKLKSINQFGSTGLTVPPIVYGTSYLGNLYKDIGYDKKLELARGWFDCTEIPVVIDSAGKYGAGLALEMIGRLLADLKIAPDDVVISNKLGWYRVPLTTAEPTFEPGVWENLQFDAVQRINYQGILDCWQQGNELLGGTYKASLVSVHDPDEYLAAASSDSDRQSRYNDVLEAYRALFDIKKQGKVKAVGIGSKDWKVIRELYQQVKFDWVMIANSFTIMKHTDEFLEFIDQLHHDGVGVINSAVFQGGFLTGGDFFDYRKVDIRSEEGQFIYNWRNRFYDTCYLFDVKPDVACIRFAMSHPAVAALALNTSKVATMHQNVTTMQEEVPAEFWKAMKTAGLVSSHYKYI